MRRLSFLCVTFYLSFACSPHEKELQLHVIARTVEQDPVADAIVSLNGKELGKTDNFGIFELMAVFPVGQKDLNLIKVSKKSAIHKFDDALIYISEQALAKARKDLYVKAIVKLQKSAIPAIVQQVAGMKDESDLKDVVPPAETTIQNLLKSSDHSTATTATKSEDKPNKLAKSQRKLATVTAPKVSKAGIASKKDEDLYNRAKRSIENNNPYEALAILKKLTTKSSGVRNYNLGILCGAHINEAVANYMVAERYLSRKEMKLAHAHYQKAVTILDDSLKKINAVPENMRKNFIVEARFNRALAIQKMYLDLGIDTLKIEAYRAWRGVYMSLNRFDSQNERRASIQKFAAQSMKDLGQKILY